MIISDPNIIAVYFHGSRANGFASSKSDSDIAVVLNKRPKETSKIIDLVENQINLPNPDIRLVDLESSPVFLFSFIKTGKVLYQKSNEDRVKFESMAMQKYYDTEHMRSIFRSYLYKTYAN
ncbi:nucleotidyltransferase domain-containing protein [Candidatus Amesbacteria bacterium]|nr:nucleotidyltransferase domain-containing protein [Candidatus Amesbacteria bacterium]